MTTLHDRLVSAVTERLELARTATRKRWVSYDGKYGCEGIVDVFAVHLHHRAGGYGAQPGRADVAHMVANQPSVIIRACEADLRRLERHRPLECSNDRCPHGMWCVGCDPDFDYACAERPWPCSEITDLAASLGVAIDEGDET